MCALLQPRTIGHQDPISLNLSPPWGWFNWQVPFSSPGVPWSMLAWFLVSTGPCNYLSLDMAAVVDPEFWLTLPPPDSLQSAFIQQSLMIHVVCIIWLWTTGSLFSALLALVTSALQSLLDRATLTDLSKREAGTQSSISEVGCTHRSRREQDAHLVWKEVTARTFLLHFVLKSQFHQIDCVDPWLFTWSGPQTAKCQSGTAASASVPGLLWLCSSGCVCPGR